MSTAFILFQQVEYRHRLRSFGVIKPASILNTRTAPGSGWTDALVRPCGTWVNRGLLPRIPSPPAISLEVLCDTVGRLDNHGRV